MSVTYNIALNVTTPSYVLNSSDLSVDPYVSQRSSGRYLVVDWVFLALSFGLIIPIVFGNLLVMIAIVRFHRLHSATHVLIASLALADLMVGVVTVPVVGLVHHLQLGFETDYVSCLTSYVLSHCPTGVSLLTLLLIAIERWVAVHRPFVYPRIFRRKYTVAAVVVLWVYIWTLGVVAMFSWNRWRPGSDDCDFAAVASRRYLLVIGGHMLGVLIVTTVLHLAVAVTAWRVRQKILKQARAVGNTLSALERDARTARMLGLVLGVFYLCWIPYFLTLPFVFRAKDRDPFWLHVWEQLAGLVVLSNSSLNPLIYAGKNADFRFAFRRLLRMSTPQVGVSGGSDPPARSPNTSEDQQVGNMGSGGRNTEMS